MNSASFFVLGVDIGTSSAKAVLFDERGGVVAKHSAEYPLLVPEPLAAEEDPDQIYHAVLTSIKQAIKIGNADSRHIACVSFSSAMHSVIAMDKHGRALTRSITWADNRSAPWADRINNELDGLAIYSRTGTPIHPMSPLSKIFWLREASPDVFGRACRFISIKEYVFYRLFGRYVVDYSIASATGLFNLKKLAWDHDALKIAGISGERLSTPVPTTYQLHGLDAGLAKEIGLRPETPFVIGASDGVLSNLGVNAIKPGIVAVTIGTSAAVRCVVETPQTDPNGRTFCYALTEKKWVIGGAANNGGIVLRWVRDQFATAETARARQLGNDPYDVLTGIAGKIAAGSEGLIFNPYLTGERAPIWNARARGSFFGLTLHHTKAHMIRATMEGIIYNLYSVWLQLEGLAGTAKQIHATGGFAQSDLWRQILSDVFNQDVYVPENHESSCLGAMVLGLYALGEIDSLDAVAGMTNSASHHQPIAENAVVYASLLPIFQNIPIRLQEEYDSLAKCQL